MKTCKIHRKRKSTQCKRTQCKRTQCKRSKCKRSKCKRSKSNRSRKRRVRRNDMGRGLGSSKPKQPTPPITIYIKPSKNVTFAEQDQWEYKSQSPRSEEDFYYAVPTNRKHKQTTTRKEYLAKKREKARANGMALRGYEKREQEQQLIDFVTGRTTSL